MSNVIHVEFKLKKTLAEHMRDVALEMNRREMEYLFPEKEFYTVFEDCVKEEDSKKDKEKL